MHSTSGEVDKNLDKIQVITSEASARGVNIVCFPELSVTGYIQESPGGIYKTEDAERIVDRLVRMAREMRVVLLAGFIEIVSEGGPYITQAITGPDGLIGLYRKTHLAPNETGSYSPGQKIELYRSGNTTFGVQLCYEAHFPEISTTMALMGADILFIPHASPRGDPEGKTTKLAKTSPCQGL